MSIEYKTTEQSGTKPTYQQTMFSMASNTVYFVRDTAISTWQYFPNIEEIVINTLSGTAVEMMLEPLLDLGGNIAAKELFRDIAKIPGTFVLMYSDVDYGSTGYKYDFANVVSQFAKTACNAILIGGSYYLSGQGLAKTVAPWANILCEIPARTIIEVGRLKQKGNDTTTPFPEYYLNHMNSTIAIGAIVSSFAKKGVASIAGVALEKYIPSHEMAKEFALRFDKMLVGQTVGSPKDTCLKILNTIYEKIKNETPIKKAGVLSAAIIGEFVPREASNLVNAYSLIFIARAAQEEGSEVAEKLVEFVEGLFTAHEALELIENSIDNNVYSPNEHINIELSGIDNEVSKDEL